MSKDKDTGTGNIGVKPGEVGNGGQLKAAPIPTKILTGQDAKALAQEYKREGDTVIFVTEDKNVFHQEHEGSARTHAYNMKLKLFEVRWD